MDEARVTLSPAQIERLKLERLEAAYKAVFGDSPATRTKDQLLVWEDLEIAGYMKSPIFAHDKTGALCAMRAAIADGRRSLMLYIMANVSPPPDLSAPQQ